MFDLYTEREASLTSQLFDTLHKLLKDVERLYGKPVIDELDIVRLENRVKHLRTLQSQRAEVRFLLNATQPQDEGASV